MNPIALQQLMLVAQYLQTFIDRGRVRGYRIGDRQLLLILDQLESLLSAIRESSDRLEKIGAPVSAPTP